jgi:hypothetical protein
LQALKQLGEDVKPLRRLERRFRAELKPRGLIGDLLFDAFWSAYLRRVLAARVEASAFSAANQGATPTAHVPMLLMGDPPTLAIDVEQDIAIARQHLPPDIFRQLLLVQRYDRHFSREMYQALAALLLMRETGEQAFSQSIAKLFGVAKGAE